VGVKQEEAQGWTIKWGGGELWGGHREYKKRAIRGIQKKRFQTIIGMLLRIRLYRDIWEGKKKKMTGRRKKNR